MKKRWMKFTAFAFAAALLVPASLLAQKEEKESKDKEVKEKKETQQIVITRKGDNKDEKVVVEIVGDKITINGKPLEEYKDKDGDISVKLHKLKDMEFLTRVPGMSGSFSYNGNDKFDMFTEDANRAMLGVTTEDNEKGAQIVSITKESAAAKMGLKEGDIITKVDDKKIESPDQLTTAIRSHKPADKVTVTYLRDSKEQSSTAELGKWKGATVFGNGQNFKMDMGDEFKKEMPRAMTMPRTPTVKGQVWSYAGGSPKLGLSVQDTDEGKGVKVIEVDNESNAAKAGIKEDDIVTEVDGKSVNSTDDMVKVIKESKDKTSVMFKLQRAGKTQNIEVKMPRKIKTTDL